MNANYTIVLTTVNLFAGSTIIDPTQFEVAFRRWVGSILPALVAIDGKSSRRTGKVDATSLHLVSAFAADAGLVLGQRGNGGEVQ